MMNENQKKLQMNRGLAIALSLLVVAAIVITVIAVVSSKRAKPNPNESTTATTTQAKPAETTTGKPTEPVIAEKVSFIAPISIGNVIGEWSADIPVFSNTMEDYRVHLGVDIEADAGTPVYAAADGTVESVEFHPMMGQTVVIAHADGYKTVYRNMQTNIPEGIEAGAAVKAGDEIGYVGDTALVEIAENPHLHFEICKDGVSENPMDYISLVPVDASADYED
ncbi:MAG: M23 family metallopeptidase [Clostridia bacterium]|nr:M23 family metallopeptidase [Clostridia bacterium]